MVCRAPRLSGAGLGVLQMGGGNCRRSEIMEGAGD